MSAKKRSLVHFLGLFMALTAMVLVGACGGDDEEPVATAVPTTAAAVPTTAAVVPTTAAVVPTTAAVVPTTAAAAPTAAPEKEEMMDAPVVSDTGSFAWTGDIPAKFNEAPMLAARVAAGELPPVEERLPVREDVLVIPVVEEIGEYGGTWRRGFGGPGDGQNMDRIMMDHPLLYDLDGATLLPNLLKSWDVSADGLTYTFKLRRGMKWSDGEPFTADDFVWASENITFNEKLNPEKEGRLGFSTFGPVLKKIDDVTFTASFPEPQAGFLDEMGTYRIAGYTLNGRVGAPLFAPAHFLEQFHEDFTTDKAALDKMIEDEGFENWETFFKVKIDVHKTIESPNVGAWIVTQDNTGDLWAFERNPYYYAVDPEGNQLPYIDKIELRLYADSEVHNLRAIAGEYDFNHRGIAFNKIPVLQQNAEKGNYRVMLWPGDATFALSINYTYGLGDVKEPPDPEKMKWFVNKKFKQALSVAINRPKINEIIYFGTGNETQPVFPTWSPHYPGDEISKRYTQYDLDLANKWFDEIGLDKKDSSGFRLRTDGSGERLTLELAHGTGVIDFPIVELLKEDFAAVGIDINLKVEEGALQTERRGGNVHELHTDGDVNGREPTGLLSGRSAFPAYSNWYSQRSGSYTLGAVVAEPPASDTTFWRLVELADESQKLRYADRVANYIENQDITSEELYYIGLVGHSPASNGTIVVKNNFRNVPERAVNLSALQNPGSGRTVQFFFKGGKNDAGY